MKLVVILLLSISRFAGCQNKPPSQKEQLFAKEALVLNDSQDWDVIGDSILKLYGLSGNKNEWSCFQYFGDEDGPKDLIDLENYKKWRQCVFRKNDKGKTFWREEEWAFKDITKEWILLSRSFYQTTN